MKFENCYWCQEKQIAAICTDTWGVEVRPNETKEANQPWHWVVIPAMGLCMGEIFYLKELAEDCEQDGIYEFFFCGPPLIITGGTGLADQSAGDQVVAMADDTSCEFCKPAMVLLQDELAYVRYDNNSLAPGHILVIPRRHVANFFDMTAQEKAAVLALLDRAQAIIAEEHRPDGYNIGINVGTAGGQSRMHVHVHLIPRYTGDVADPRGGIRCVLAGRTTAAH